MLDNQLPPDAFDLMRAVSLSKLIAFLKRLEELGEEPLVRFLEHATATVPFYGSLLGCERSLESFPVVDRNLVYNNQEAFRSTVVLNDGPKILNRTNGTLGPSLPVAFDSASSFDAHQYSFARVLSFWPNLQSVFQPNKVAVCSINDVRGRRRSSIALVALNDSILRELVIRRSRLENQHVVEYLRSLNNGIIIYGKPHVLLELAKAAGKPLRAALLITAGENLYESDKTRLSEFFGCKIANCYTSAEAGLIAISCPFERGFHVLSDRCVVEVANSDGQLSRNGTGELVITNFMNWAQAFIRYRLGDFASLVECECECGHRGQTVVSIRARDAEGFVAPDGQFVTSESLERLCDAVPQIDSYQFRQQRTGCFLFLWVPKYDYCRELPRVFIEQLRSRLVDVGIFRTQRLVGRGGKMRRFIREAS